ncbi:MAG: fibronectin type III-like domain-contianing protein [Gemmatimonadaceae bacterium]
MSEQGSSTPTCRSSPVARPVMELRGFTRIHLAPGEARQVGFPLGPEHLRMLDGGMRWVVEPGEFRVMVGSSSKNIRLRGSLAVQRHGRGAD